MPRSAEPETPEYVVRGRIVDKQKTPLDDLLVRAYDSDPNTPDQELGEAKTEHGGKFEIRFGRSSFAPGGKEAGGPDLYIRVYRGDGEMLLAQSGFRADAPKVTDLGDIRIEVNVRADVPSGTVRGRVTMPNGAPGAGITVHLHKFGFGGRSTMAGHTLTRPDGTYSITYSLHDGASSLELRALDPRGKEVTLSQRIHDAGGREARVVDLVAPTRVKTASAEFDRLASGITAAIGSLGRLATAKETHEQRDITLLARTTGYDARLVALAAKSERLAADKDIPFSSAVTYALVRAGLPSEKRLLAGVHPGVARKAVESMEKQGIVRLPKKDLQDFETKFAAFCVQALVRTTVPGSTATYADFLGQTGLSSQKQTLLAQMMFEHEGTALWDALRQGGLSAKEVSSLQMMGKMAFISGFSLPMTKHLAARMAAPEDVVAKGLFEAERWEQEIFAAAGVDHAHRKKLSADERAKLDGVLPATVLGEAKAGDKDVVSRVAAYAAGMASTVRLSYPTQIIARRLETDAKDRFGMGDARPATAKVLARAAAKGFVLGRTRVGPFFDDKRSQGVFEGIPAAQVPMAKERLKTLHRLWQLTPDDATIQVMVAMGLTDAQATAEIRLDRFAHLFLETAKSLGVAATANQARLIHGRARQIAHATRTIATMAKTSGGSS